MAEKKTLKHIMIRSIAVLCSLTLLCPLFALSACKRPQGGNAATPENVDNSTDDPKGDRPAMIRVGGKLYYSTNAMVLYVDKSDIIGYTTSYTDGEPSKDGETNFSRKLGLPYAWEGDGIAVKYSEQWHLFLPKDGNTPDESQNFVNLFDYTPDYDSTDTRDAGRFLETLRRDGYHLDGEIHKNYNVDGIKEVFNITPAAIAEQEPELELFLVKDGYHCFMMYKGAIYSYDTFGGHHHRLVLWDYDEDGTKDLFSYCSYGSGVTYLALWVTNLKTMETKSVITRGVLWVAGFTFNYDGSSIFLDGKKLTYSDGEFHCEGLALGVQGMLSQ